MPYENDVFISYAHIDDQSLIDGGAGWVSELHRVLRIRLSQLLGVELKVWRDARLRGNEDFAERLDSECPSSAVLVSVVSPRYLKSDWCQRELATFAANESVRLGHRSRVFKVLKTPVDREEEPEVMKPLLGYEFYRRDDSSGRFREFPSSEDDYLARLDDLAHDISETLRLVEPPDSDSVEPAQPKASAAAAGQMSVYVATTSSDIAEPRERLCRELRDRGYRVLPDCPLPLVGNECRAAVREMLAESSTSVHLVGRYYGSIPEGDEQSMVHLQVDLARERAAGPDYSQLLWIAPDMEPAEERQARFIEALRSGEGDERGTELLSTCLETLKSYAFETLELARSRAESRDCHEADDADEIPPSVYVVYTPEDVDTAERIVDVLYDRGLDIMQSVFDGDEAELRQLHQSNLQDCNSVLILYQSAPAVWLETRLRELRKCMGYGREAPLAAKAVYVTGEETSHKRMLRSRDAAVLKDFEMAPDAALESFVSAALERG